MTPTEIGFVSQRAFASRSELRLFGIVKCVVMFHCRNATNTVLENPLNKIVRLLSSRWLSSVYVFDISYHVSELYLQIRVQWAQ